MRWCRMLGYSSKEGTAASRCAHAGFQLLPAEHYRQFAEPMQETGIVRSHEEVLRRKDGSTVYVMVNAFAVRDAKNKVTQFRGLMLDITDLKTYQSRTAESAAFQGRS